MSEHKISIAGAIENSGRSPSYIGNGLLLVEKRNTGLLALPAGHLELELPISGIIREIEEETGLRRAQYTLNPHPFTYAKVSPTKVSLGLLYTGKTIHPIENQGYVVDSEEISRVRPYSVDELLQLLAHPEALYKPEFNQFFIAQILLWWIQLKYAFESHSFQKSLALDYGITEAQMLDFAQERE
ncbi:NUDIX hydrolase [Candidatus Woesebacteria bacterium]|nr:NUDIX hydrolase [Candidatus Woesebacteria bacterium]